MSTNRILQIVCAGSGQTEQLAERLAANLKGGLAIELISDLGGGKTTFVRGLARGLGSKDHVSSPTFKLSNVYTVPELKNSNPNEVYRLYHYDFYRLSEAGLIGQELHEILTDPNGIVVVEWGEVASNVLPKDLITIRFIVTSERVRQVVISCPSALDYVLKGVK